MESLKRYSTSERDLTRGWSIDVLNEGVLKVQKYLSNRRKFLLEIFSFLKTGILTVGMMVLSLTVKWKSGTKKRYRELSVLYGKKRGVKK